MRTGWRWWAATALSTGAACRTWTARRSCCGCWTGIAAASELAQKLEAHARDFGLDIQPYRVQEVYAEGELRVVRTVDGPEYAAGAVIVCSGGEPVKLGVPGEEELAGRGVSYCAVCDGPFFKD